MIKKIIAISFLIIVLLLSITFKTSAQEIDFGQYGTYSLSIIPVPGQDELDFGTVIVGTGVVNIELTDPEIVILEIEGVRFLDVFVTIDAPPFLELTPNPDPPDATTQIPLTIEFAYANLGASNNDVSNARLVTGNAVRFGMLRRASGPPGPPPTPPHGNYTPPMETAYLFIYGSIDVVGGLKSGAYQAEITVTVDYEI